MENPLQSADISGKPITDLDLATFKSVYYWMNAKPDTQIKVYEQEKSIELNDIKTLNRQVVQKLKTCNVLASISTIDLIFEKNDIVQFKNWEEFNQYSWDIHSETESISLNWDVNIQLHNYPIPQRHTLKVRIGSAIKPSEMVHLIFTSDNDVELKESQAFLVAKVDFVNTVIGNELLNIVQVWYENLKPVDEVSRYQKFLQKRRNYIAYLMHYITPIICLAILLILFRFKVHEIPNFVFDKEFVSRAYTWFITALMMFFAGNFLGQSLAHNTFVKIGKIKDEPYFNITAKDRNALIEVRKKNKGLVKETFWKIGGLLVTTIFTFLLEHLLEHFYK